MRMKFAECEALTSQPKDEKDVRQVGHQNININIVCAELSYR